GALILASEIRSLPVMLAASVLAGAGLGLAFRGSLAEINRIAPKGREGAVTASYYLGIYAGSALPVIGAGTAALSLGLLGAVRGFAEVMGVLCLVNLILVAANQRRSARPQGSGAR
ncbi:MAG: MFS transporter, partial [Actinomycetota bacterium]